MKRYLMRSGKTPFDDSLINTVVYNSIGSNVGNLLFADSCYRALSVEGKSVVDSNNYKYEINKVDEINEKYDAFIIPLANAFRPDFKEGKSLTAFVKKLKIPCVVIGAGIQLPYDSSNGLAKSYPMDNDVKEMCSAILEKSNCIGVRGEITAEYLKQLGFGNHVRVIGCPSMFLHGDDVKVKKLPNGLTPDSKISLNARTNVTPEIWAFLEGVYNQFEDSVFIGQTMHDLKLVSYGVPNPGSDKINFPKDMTHPFFQDNKMKCFINSKEWIKYLKQRDFTIGACIHGTIASILAGTPALLIAVDSRTKELADYYNIPYVAAEEVGYYTSIYELYEKADFTKLHAEHKNKFKKFVDFLNENNLTNIYEKGNVSSYDYNISRTELTGPIGPFCFETPEVQAKMLTPYWEHLDRRLKKM